MWVKLSRGRHEKGEGISTHLRWSNHCFAGYQVAYRLDSGDPNQFITIEVGPDTRQFTASSLTPESAYIFRISAKTEQGWGTPSQAVVITTEIRGKANTYIIPHLILMFINLSGKSCVFWKMVKEIFTLTTINHETTLCERESSKEVHTNEYNCTHTSKNSYGIAYKATFHNQNSAVFTSTSMVAVQTLIICKN